MKTTQPPITSDEELAGYRMAADQLRHMIERRKDIVDVHLRYQLRYQLHHLYDYFKGIQDAIAASLAARPLPSKGRG